MAITLTRLSNADVLTLSDRLQWTNEHTQWAAAQVIQRGTNGSLHIHERLRVKGRSIVLDGKASNAWTSRADMDQLLAWSDLAGETFALVLRGVARNVVFDRSSGPAVEGDDLNALVDGEYSADLWVRPHLKFLEV